MFRRWKDSSTSRSSYIKTLSSFLINLFSCLAKLIQPLKCEISWLTPTWKICNSVAPLGGSTIIEILWNLSSLVQDFIWESSNVTYKSCANRFRIFLINFKSSLIILSINPKQKDKLILLLKFDKDWGNLKSSSTSFVSSGKNSFKIFSNAISRNVPPRIVIALSSLYSRLNNLWNSINASLKLKYLSSAFP